MLFGSVFAAEDDAAATMPGGKNEEAAKDGPEVTKSAASHLWEGEDTLNINNVLEDLKGGFEGKGTQEQPVETTGDSEGDSGYEDKHGKGEEDQLPSKDGTACEKEVEGNQEHPVEITGDSSGDSGYEDQHGRGAEDQLPSKDGAAAEKGVEGQKEAGEEANMGEDKKKGAEGEAEMEVEVNYVEKGDGPEDAKDMSMEDPLVDSTEEAMQNPKGDSNDLTTLSELFKLQRKKRNHARDKLSRACKL